MPVRNKPGFIPASAKHQPKLYTEKFGRINAVYQHPTTKATIYIEIDADIWNHKRPEDACGDLLVLYQADCRRPLRKHKTLKAALEQIDRIMDNPNFGEKLNPKPVHAEVYGTCFANKNLTKNEKKFRRKGNGEPFRLTYFDKTVLRMYGYPETDFKQIELAANKATFVLDDTASINAHEARELLGQETFLSGLGRSAFHWSCTRNSPDGKHKVYFNASAMFKN